MRVTVRDDILNNDSIKRIVLIIIVALVILLLSTTQAFAVDIRVLLETSNADVFKLSVENGNYELQDDKGRYVAEIRRGAKIEIENHRTGLAVFVEGKLLIEDKPSLYLDAHDDDCIFEYQAKPYRGSMHIVRNNSDMQIINYLDLECYLYGVVGKEIGYGQPAEALKAQAVASRSFAMAKKTASGRDYDISASTVTGQFYGGYAEEQVAAAAFVIRAVNATAGEVVCYRGLPFECYFHSNSGGHTEDIANVWSGVIPLKGVSSPYDDYAEKSAGSSVYRWQVTYSAAQLKSMAESYAGRGIGEYRGIELSTIGVNGKPSASGRVMEFTIKGSNGQVSAKRDEIRVLLGSLKSTLFSLNASDIIIAAISSNTTFYVLDKGQKSAQPVDDIGAFYVQDGSGGVLSRLSDWGMNFTIKGAKGSVKVGSGSSASTTAAATSSSSAPTITLYGRGYGHGVGMSQWGAIGMAANGYSYMDILAHYYNMEINQDFTVELFR
ncbi:MAG: SpoIID/LytB domain-containing protein [Clostridiales bacterium]|nr:SpoIID/LytB domain-containing protein [Clostridiales bacterium]